jgi:hypothetical protein
VFTTIGVRIIAIPPGRRTRRRSRERWIGSAQLLITGHDSKIRQLTDVSHCNLQHHF